MPGRVVPVAVADLGTSLARYRIADETAARRIGALYLAGNKLDPLTGYVSSGNRIELVDGFKRREALKILGQDQTEVLLLDTDDVGALASLAILNRPHGAISALEEAWVIHALHRRHQQPLDRIAERFGRHKSWTCRRMALAERLHERVQGMVRDGSIPTAIAMELLPLRPRNQEALAVVVTRHGLTRDQVRLLACLLQRAPSEGHERYVLANPLEALRSIVEIKPEQPGDLACRFDALQARAQALNREVQRLTIPAGGADVSCRAAFDQLLADAERFVQLLHSLRGGIYGRQPDSGNPGPLRAGTFDPVDRPGAGHLPPQRPLGYPGTGLQEQRQDPNLGSEQSGLASNTDNRVGVGTPAPAASEEAQTVQAR